jgi:hypothetical protein
MKLAQIHTLLESIKGSTFASLDTITEVKLKGGKKNPMLGRVTKHTVGNRVQLFTSHKGYMNMVNRRLEAEGKVANFEPKPLPWGARIEDSPLIEHNGKFYLQMIFQKGGTSTYMLDNKPIDKALIEGLDEKDITAGRTGLEDSNAIVVRTFALDSIREIRMMGQTVKG